MFQLEFNKNSSLFQGHIPIDLRDRFKVLEEASRDSTDPVGGVRLWSACGLDGQPRGDQ